jgi:hypothetical protein
MRTAKHGTVRTHGSGHALTAILFTRNRLTTMLDGFDKFDCLIFIPDLDELDMDGKTIVLSPQVLKMLDKMCMRELVAGNISSLREQKDGALVSKSSN